MGHALGWVQVEDGGVSQYVLQLADIRMTLAHRVSPQRGWVPVLARHWFTGSVAIAPSRLLISSAGLVIMELVIPPEMDRRCLSLELPTPACLELMIDADSCTRQLRGVWELRLYTAEAERLASYLDQDTRSA